ncbi:NAD-dependent epimerase/dehydratase family protein [Flammeovirga sp. SJP92]|uniref:NAD-dependent epimerase/dehydratase family protein n=1 Tax=Flammeovirga sp. SJP92 TaxID=1775430 RepID=UPI0007884E5F|nr:NAD-dependent epimerase/dehydratase family protein [Flammeovirga sp. SJP92]KXX68576.1 capsule biosynthesis protein CapI [Flammeovirga sp. SJP92]
MKILVTGVAGFIGFHVAKKLIDDNIEVIGIDNINDYYPMTLKFDRLKELGIQPDFIRYNNKVKSETMKSFTFLRLDITDESHLLNLFNREKFDIVIHLAAQAGVRYSLDNPKAYIKSNIEGFNNILEACRNFPVKHLVYASSSSVYGMNKEQPFSVKHKVDSPVSLYAATKKSNELMAHSYSYLYNIPTTGLRFFTVYGPWGRPDMAPMLFAKSIIEGKPIKVFNNGNLERDFTYIDDIITGITKIMSLPPCEKIPYRILNIGNSKPVKLGEFINEIEEALGEKAIKEMYPMQDGDVYSTFADVSELQQLTNYKPTIALKEGITKFIKWYTAYFN